jgi:catechol 2,3-dioxygenase-like lactoylglutathione lyase family enzyme
MHESTGLRHNVSRLLIVLAAASAASCAPAQDAATTAGQPASRPSGTPSLHHVGLNSTDPDAAIAWYLAVWPSAERTVMDGRPAVASEMYLVFREVDEPPPGAFDPTLGRARGQSPFWHIGAFVNTTDAATRLNAIGVSHLPLYTAPSDATGVWRSGLAPYQGTLARDAILSATPAPPRPGGFSYLLAPDGVLFEMTGGPDTEASMSHVHLFHEEPQCAAAWYVEALGMTLPPQRNADGSSSEGTIPSPCEAERGEAGWPSLERAGTIRQPRGGVSYANGSMSWYPRQCTPDRCGDEGALVPSRGQALDHIGFAVDDLDGWHRWLVSLGVTILEEPHPFDQGRALLIEAPDGLAIELVEGL